MGKEGQYDLRLADSSFKTISPDKESDKDNELYESKMQQTDIHPTKLLKTACIKLLQMVSTSVGIHGDKMQNEAVRVFITMFYSILAQRNNSLSIGLETWKSLAFLRGILKSQNVSKYLTTDLWTKLFFQMLETPTQNERDVYKKVQCLRLLQAILIQWNDQDADRIENIVAKLFLLLGSICMSCPHDNSLTQLPIGIKSKVLSSASHSGTVAEELITLLRKLHTLSLWNESINNFISQKLCIAADLFIDTEREEIVPDEKLNVVAALNIIGGYDPRPRIGIDLIYDSVKCSIFRMNRSGHVVLSVHGSNETKSISFTKIEPLIEQGIFSLSKFPLNEMLLNSLAVLMYGMSLEKNKCYSTSFDLPLLSNQQTQLSALRSSQVLFRHQSLLKSILRQRSPGIIKYYSDDSMSDDTSKTAKNDDKEDKSSEGSNHNDVYKQEYLVQSMLSRSIQSSPLKACYTQAEMEIAAIAICQTLSAHFKNNIPVSQVKFQNVKYATMVHGCPIYNDTFQETINSFTANGSETSRANPTTKLVIQIMEMGFSRKTVEFALKQITNRVEILPSAEHVLSWIIEHPDSIQDEETKGTLNKINSFNVASAIDSDNESTCSENLNSSSISQQDKQVKFAKREDFKSADQYAIYIRSHICPGMTVRCCRDFEEIRAGDVGIVLKVEPDELHDLNVRVDFKSHERPFWMCFVHLEMLENPSDDIKCSNITYGSHVKIKSSSMITRTQMVKNGTGIVTAINGRKITL
jgi:E3 ubiquitin-protein ligase HERC2